MFPSFNIPVNRTIQRFDIGYKKLVPLSMGKYVNTFVKPLDNGKSC